MLDFDDAHNNDWLAVNQFTVSENEHTRRPDVVLEESTAHIIAWAAQEHPAWFWRAPACLSAA